MWLTLAVALLIAGAAVAFWGSPREGIGAPTRLTLAGLALMAIGVAIAGWRFVAWFGPIVGYRLSH